VGFVKDPSGVAALYLGKQEGKDLVYMGKVGTGWSRTVSSQIRKPKATWVEPKFYADVEYRDITSEGLLRASSFKGLIKSRTLTSCATGLPNLTQNAQHTDEVMQ
jgi:bifunctional non-homologous end joining protein LigD